MSYHWQAWILRYRIALAQLPTRRWPNRLGLILLTTPWLLTLIRVLAGVCMFPLFFASFAAAVLILHHYHTHIPIAVATIGGMIIACGPCIVCLFTMVEADHIARWMRDRPSPPERRRARAMKAKARAEARLARWWVQQQHLDILRRQQWMAEHPQDAAFYAEAMREIEQLTTPPERS